MAAEKCRRGRGENLRGSAAPSRNALRFLLLRLWWTWRYCSARNRRLAGHLHLHLQLPLLHLLEHLLGSLDPGLLIWRCGWLFRFSGIRVDVFVGSVFVSRVGILLVGRDGGRLRWICQISHLTCHRRLILSLRRCANNIRTGLGNEDYARQAVGI